MSATNVASLAAAIGGVAERCNELTGTSLALPQLGDWQFAASTEDQFRSLVTEVYKWWREAWGDEVGFLGRVANRSHYTRTVATFTTLVRLLRTSYQHNPKREELEFRRDWLRTICGSEEPSGDEWSVCTDELLTQTEAAVLAFHSIVDEVASHAPVLKQWKTRTQVQGAADTKETRVRVTADLGLNFRPHSIDHMDREIVYQWRERTKTAVDDPQTALDSVVERYLAAQALQPLPCHHNDVLEELGLVGDRRAASALIIAHGVAGIASFPSTEDFLALVTSIWASIPDV